MSLTRGIVHTWGRHHVLDNARLTLGNTPTHVGKTAWRWHLDGVREKHPHARGEDDSSVSGAFGRRETPPRTWGRPNKHSRRIPCRRNTPTHVGKTGGEILILSSSQKHPHARGEDSLLRRTKKLLMGNTPTHVGKTSVICARVLREKKHPHARGEDNKHIFIGKGVKETPPRTWGRLLLDNQ